jgi:hypothetical protein
MEIVTGVALAGWASTVFLFLRYVRSRDEHEQTLWDRIQAPATVVEARQVASQPAKISYVGEVREDGDGTIPKEEAD